MDKVCWAGALPCACEFRAMDKVCWVASIPLLVASFAIAVSEQEQRDTGG